MIQTTTPKRVLLAEDDRSLRQLFTELLTEEGFAVVAVSDGLEAFEAFLSQGPFDAVVTDCELPGLTGPQLVARLREQDSAVPALLMSGQMVLDDADQRRLKVGQTLRKPFGFDSLLHALRRLLPA